MMMDMQWKKLAEKLYFVTNITIALTFSISTAVHEVKKPFLSLYSRVFLTYNYTAGVVAIGLLIHRLKQINGTTTQPISPESNNPGDDFKVKRHSEDIKLTSSLPQRLVPGFNIYVLLGAVIFLFGSLILYLLRVFEAFELAFLGNITMWEGLYTETFLYLLQIIFSCFQTFFIFKYHRTNFSKPWRTVDFSFLQLVVTNLSSSIFSLVYEALELYDQHIMSHRLDNNLTDITLTAHYYNRHVDEMDPEKLRASHKLTTASKASPFLFPCIMEYSVLSLNMTHAMYQTNCRAHCHETTFVTQTENVAKYLQHQQEPFSLFEKKECKSAHKGFFCGLALLASYCVYLTIFFALEKDLKHRTMAFILYREAQGSLILLSLITVICLFYSMSFKLQYTLINHEGLKMDQRLLWLSYFAYLSYSLFRAISLCYKLVCLVHPGICKEGFHEASSDELLEVILLTANTFLSIGQITLQMLYIVDALHRTIYPSQRLEKPGRSLLTLLLIMNIIFWLNENLRFKYDEMNYNITEFYGVLPWCLMVSAFLPFLIYFRFHSSVLLAEIWSHAYHISPMHEFSNRNSRMTAFTLDVEGNTISSPIPDQHSLDHLEQYEGVSVSPFRGDTIERLSTVSDA